MSLSEESNRLLTFIVPSALTSSSSKPREKISDVDNDIQFAEPVLPFLPSIVHLNDEAKAVRYLEDAAPTLLCAKQIYTVKKRTAEFDSCMVKLLGLKVNLSTLQDEFLHPKISTRVSETLNRVSKYICGLRMIEDNRYAVLWQKMLVLAKQPELESMLSEKKLEDNRVVYPGADETVSTKTECNSSILNRLTELKPVKIPSDNLTPSIDLQSVEMPNTDHASQQEVEVIPRMISYGNPISTSIVEPTMTDASDNRTRGSIRNTHHQNDKKRAQKRRACTKHRDEKKLERGLSAARSSFLHPSSHAAGSEVGFKHMRQSKWTFRENSSMSDSDGEYPSKNKGFHMAPDLNQKVPESCLLIVVGVVIGLVLWCIKNIHITALTPDTFFIYMLPPIILDAGYFMPNRLFFDNLGTILLFAVVGTIFNTLTIGGSLCLVNAMGFFDGDTSVLEFFLFAALISAVDPVAVLAVFEEIHVNEILYIVVFGESLLNDAVTVVLYHMFEAYNQMGPSNILYTDLLASIASFLVVAMGGTIIGVVWGFLTGFVTRFTHQARVIEPILILVMAYISYLNAEMFHMSGILAITFCGITMKNYVEANISHKSHTTVKYTMKMLSSSSETIIFMFLGVSTVSENHHWDMAFIILTIFFCTIYRFAGVMLLSALVNHFRLYKLNTVDKFVMSYGGLRGAVAFALALLINPRHVKSREMFVSTTIAVIYFTVFIQGITIRPLVKILNVKKAEKKKPTMNERIHERFMDHMMAGIEDILGHHGNHHLRDRFKRFDNQFIRPYLLRNYQGAEPKILETYSKLAMKDALDFMRRNASTLGNISNAESASGIFRNYTAANLPASSSCSQIDGAWNVDLQEMDYNPSKKDLTDAKIHHLLAAELCQSTKKATDPLQHRRLSYSRHIVDERDLLQQGIQRANSPIKRSAGGDSRRHHHRRSRRSGRMNHVTFPPTKQNSSESADKQSERKNVGDDNNSSDEWDAGITFTVNPATLDETDARLQTKRASNSCRPEPNNLSEKQIADIHLPWQRFGCDETEDELSAVDMKIPWGRNEEESDLDAEIMKKREYPYWKRSKEYLPCSSRATPVLERDAEKPRLSSVLNLFRKDRSRCSIARLESNDSLDRRYSATVVRTKDQRTASVTTTFLSPYRDINSPLRRGSMMELGATNSKISDEDFLAVTYQNSDGSPRFRSGSMCIPRRRDGFLTISTKPSSSSSSSSDDEESLG